MKTLDEMTTEVVEWGKSKGWYDKPISFDEAMALLHSEVSEALEAWRDWGMADMTELEGNGRWLSGVWQAKPEGVGSEFADILIRLLGDCFRFGMTDLDQRVNDFDGVYGLRDSFLENMNTLHILIARVSMLHSDDFSSGPVAWKSDFTGVYIYLRQLCENYSIDLEAEYNRKMAYNRTRPYRHGGKVA